MSNNRVTPEGQAMGSCAAKLAERGSEILSSKGLADVNHPAFRDEMCKSCACRLGTVPNGCLQTQLDFLKAVVEGEKFLCHAPKDGRLCAGWIRARAAIAGKPVPIRLRLLIAQHEYSPPDDESEGERV